MCTFDRTKPLRGILKQQWPSSCNCWRQIISPCVFKWILSVGVCLSPLHLSLFSHTNNSESFSWHMRAHLFHVCLVHWERWRRFDHCAVQTYLELNKSLHCVFCNKLVVWGNPRQGNTRLIMHCYSPLAEINNLLCLLAFTTLPREARNSRTEAGKEGNEGRKDSRMRVRDKDDK